MMRFPRRLAVLSTHTSPLARAGTTKAGGMNVYVAELSRQLGAMGWEVDVFTRRDRADAPCVERLAPGVRLFHVAAGTCSAAVSDRGSGACGGVHRGRGRRDESGRPL